MIRAQQESIDTLKQMLLQLLEDKKKSKAKTPTKKSKGKRKEGESSSSAHTEEEEHSVQASIRRGRQFREWEHSFQKDK